MIKKNQSHEKNIRSVQTALQRFFCSLHSRIIIVNVRCLAVLQRSFLALGGYKKTTLGKQTWQAPLLKNSFETGFSFHLQIRRVSSTMFFGWSPKFFSLKVWLG